MISTWSPDKARRSFRYAAGAHRLQVVPGTAGLPYLMHVGMVAIEIMHAHTIESFNDPDLAVQVAFLHDVIEDTQTKMSDITDVFGDVVARGVQALTKDVNLPKEGRMRDSLTRIKLREKEVWAVKLADRITNMHEPPKEWGLKKRQSYRDEARLSDRATARRISPSFRA